MILMVGAGAVGTILAAHLSAAKQPLKLYARPKDMAAFAGIKEIRVDPASPDQPAVVAPAPKLTPTLDLSGVKYLLICVKYPALGALLDQLPPVPSGCTVVSTLNGVAPLRMLRRRMPQTRILPMTVMYNGQLPGPLHAHITTRAEIIVGGGDTALAALFAGSGMDAKTAEGDSAVWGKLLINLANAICAVTHTTFKDLLSQRDLRVIYTGVLDEATDLLTRADYQYQLPIAVSYSTYRKVMLYGGPLPWWIARAKNGLREGAYPSMVSDIEQGRDTEVAQLNGEIAELARARGMQAPVNSALASLVTSMHGKLPPPYLTPAELRKRLGL